MNEYERLHSEAEHTRSVLSRLADEGGVLGQIADGEWDERLSADRADEMADLLAATAEQVRATRAIAGSVEPPKDHQAGWLPLNRKERYYTGTVLPMLIAGDGFAHLKRLLRLCGLSNVDVRGDLEGHVDVQFFTEYGFAESVFTEADKQVWPDAVEADTPDVVIAGPDWLLAIEAKMFHDPNAAALDAQMRRQKVLVDMWDNAQARTHDGMINPLTPHGVEPGRVVG